MSNFVTDLTDLPFATGDLNPVPVGADAGKFCTSAMWNTAMQAIIDVRTALLTTPNNFYGIIGDSNGVGVVQVATSSTEFGLDVPDEDIKFTIHYAIAASDPPTFVNLTTGPLRPHTDGGIANLGFYSMSGKTIISRTGSGAWLFNMSISGIRLADWHPASTYMLASTGTNLYNTWKARMQSLLATAGRQLGGVIVNLGTNDAVLTGDASNFAARITSLTSQIRTDFGAQVVFAWIRTHSATSPGDHTFLATVRAAIDAAALSIPNLRSVHIDNSVKLVGDLLHYNNDTSPSAGDLAATAILDLQARARLFVPGAQSDIVAWAPASFGSGNPTPAAPADIQHGDLLLMPVFVGPVASTIATPSGWTLVGSQTVATVSGIVERIALFSLAVTQTMLDANDGTIPAVTVTITGGVENAAQIFCLRGANGALFPVVVASQGFIDPVFGAGPSSATGVTTTANAQRVLIFSGGWAGGPIGATNVVSNSNLTLVTEVKDQAYQVPDTASQTIALTKGIKATAGATGVSTINAGRSMVIAAITVATT